MSFAERHKRWLLPVLGLGLAGVVWLNLPARSLPAAPAGEREPGPGGPGPAGPGQPEPGPAAAAPEPARAGSGPGGEPGLEALAAPSPEDNDAAPLLLAGRRPLTGDLRAGSRPPVLHPGLWGTLAEGPEPAPPAPGPGQAAPAPPLALDFILESGSRQEAWIGGRAFRPGDALPGGYVLRRIVPGGAVLAGPGGDRLLSLHAPAAAPVAPGGSP